MPVVSKPIQTSAPQLKDLLAKTGRSLKQKDNYDKLEVLGFLVEQINDKLKCGYKMKLCLADLNAFLSREGLAEELDFKGCVSKIIQFVYYQHERLGHYVQARESGNRNTDLLDSLLKLWAMDNQYVEECFAIELYSPPVSNGEKHEHVAETNDAKVETPADDRKRPSNSETQNPSTEVIVKRRRTDDRLLEAPAGASLFAELKRLVPLDLLAIEDVAKQDTDEKILSERRRIAQAEVDRILKADSEGSAILLGDSASERLGSFRTIVRLLHPEVGLVSDEDVRAIKALDLSLKYFVKSELSSEDKAQ